MKLIFCPSCQDIIKLGTKYIRYCACHKSWGKYWEDGLNATIGGEAIPLGINNISFAHALGKRSKEGLGTRFEAFVIPHKCGTIKKE